MTTRTLRNLIQVVPHVGAATRFNLIYSSSRISSARFPSQLLNGTGLRGPSIARALLYTTKADESLLKPSSKDFIPGRMVIGFKCKVCDHPSVKQMSKHAYEKGVVIIKCDGCKNHHLIADHLGWFDSQKKVGTIEDIMKEKGESVTRLDFSSDQQVTEYDAATRDNESQETAQRDEGLLEFVAKTNFGDSISHSN